MLRRCCRGLGGPTLALLGFLGIGPVAGWDGLSAQVEVVPALEGSVLRGSAPLGGATVVLHAVDALDAGRVDSVIAAPDGTFRILLPAMPDPGGAGEVYFASVRHDGLLYFGPAIGAPADLDSAYVIQAYDTAAAPVAGAELPLEVRYLLVEDSPDGWVVTDLFQLGVQGENTLVPADEGVVWAHPLPTGVRDARVAGGDVSPTATEITAEAVRVSMPLSPGSRQLALTYRIDSLGFELPLPGRVDEVELLVREPAPTLEVTGLSAVDPIDAPDGTYRRFVGVGLEGVTLSVRTTETPSRLPVRELMVVMALIMAALGVWVVRRGGGAAARATASAGPGGAAPMGGAGGGGAPAASAQPGAVPPGAAASASPAPGDVRDRLLLAIAQLDEELEGAGADRAAMIRNERARLLERLRELS